MRWIKTAGGLLCIMVLMASCIRVEATIKVEDDGSGSVEYLSALNTEVLTSVLGDFDIPESEIGDTSELCDDFESDFSVTSDLPDGAVLTPYDQDGFCGTLVQYNFGPSTDPSGQIQAILEDSSARLYKEGDNWFFESAVDTDDLTAEADDAPQAMLDALFGDASYRITVDLPGRAIDGENNATSVGDDGVFTWEIDILNPPTQLFAQTEPGSGGGSGGGGGGISPLLIGLIVLALAAAVGFFLWKRKSAAAPEPKAAGIYQPDDATATLPGATANMPIVDGPAITATPPAAASVLGADAIKETVVINPADLQQSIQDAATETAAASPEPVFDEALNAWVIDDPTRGRLRHDPTTDIWGPV